jgi:hypothetical protein
VRFAVLVLGLLTAAVASPQAAPLRTGPIDGEVVRSASAPALFPTSAFAPSAAARATSLHLEGHLSLRPRGRPDYLAVLKDSYPETPDRRPRWPDLDVDLVADGLHVIPALAQPQASPGAPWSWVLAPGRIWSEPQDHGGARLLLPVALEEANANCVHNGRLLVLFDAAGAVIGAAAQVDSEGCAYFRFDAFARVPATFAAGPVAGGSEIVTRYRAEVAARPHSASLADLHQTYPSLDIAALARAAGPSAVWGLDDGRSDFVAPCMTRAGEDPLCQGRALPSYSTAKSLVGAQGLMRLEALAPGSALARVADHVPECAADRGWSEVRLIDLLDMTSGHYRLEGPEADEDSPAMAAFFDAATAARKLAFACGQPRRSDPGAHFAYHTADSFLLGAAMSDLLRRRRLGEDLYGDVITPIWRAIGQSPMLDATRRTADARALPFTGFGLAYTRDDIVRAARFLAHGGGVDGRPWLEPHLLADALQRASPGSGAHVSPHIVYHLGFWARDVGPLIGCPRAVWTPFMSGYGGISVVMFPNDVRFWSFNEDNHFDWGEAAAEVDKIRPLCA